MVVGGQAVEEQPGVARDQRRRRLEVAGLPFDQRAAGVVEFGVGRRPVAEEGQDLAADVVERLGQPVGLERGRDHERAARPTELEVAPDPVGEPLLLAELGVEPRGELAAEDLVPDRQVGVSRGRAGASRAGRPGPPPAGPPGGRAGAAGSPPDAAALGQPRAGAGRAGPVAEPPVERGDHGVGVDVARNHAGGPGWAIVGLVERPEVVHGQAGDGRLLARGGEAVRVVDREQGPEHHPVRPSLGRVALGLQAGQGLGVDPSPFLAGKRRVPEEVDGQVEAGIPVRRQALHADVSPIPAGRDRQARPHPLGGEGDLVRGPRGRPLVEEVGRQAGQPAALGAMRRGAGVEDERRGDDRQVAAREDPERHPVGQLAGPRASGRGTRRRGRTAGADRSSGLPIDGRRPLAPPDDRQLHPGLAVEVVAGRGLDGVERDRGVAVEVGRDPPRVAEVGVVGVEAVGHPAEAADVVQRVDEAREPAVLDPFEFGLVDPCSAIAASSARMIARAAGERGPGAEGRVDPERAGQLATRLVGADVLRQARLDDELAEQPARLAAAEDVAEQRQRGVVGAELRGGVPGQVQPVELDPVADRDGDSASSCGSLAQGRRLCVPPGRVPK